MNLKCFCPPKTCLCESFLQTPRYIFHILPVIHKPVNPDQSTWTGWCHADRVTVERT